MRRAAAVAALVLLGSVLVTPAAAWQEASTVNRQAAPAAALSAMRAGGVSLRYEERDLGGEKFGIHLYVVPKDRNPENPLYDADKPRTGPIRRDEVTVGPALKPSPFYVDVWALSAGGGKPALLHSDSYTDEGDISSLAVRYLRPAERRGPILLLEGGFTHWKRWTLIGYPDGVRGKRSFVHTFLWGGEGGMYVLQQFDSRDARGFLQVTERAVEEEGAKEKRRVYRWDGERFSDPEARYFVLAASDRTREGAAAFVRKHELGDIAEIVRTDAYPKLAPGLYAVVLRRARTRAEAEDMAKLWRQQKLAPYVKQAY